MRAITYSDIALDWSVESPSNRRYKIIAAIVVLLMLALGILLSSIDLPPEPRQARREVPPRIAEFLIEKKKAQPKIEAPKPEAVKPKPKPKPKVRKVQEKQADEKPLTEAQKAARERAAESGLLALSNELADLMETDDISAMLGGAVTSTAQSTSGSRASDERLLGDSGSGSGGVGNEQVAAVVGRTVLSQREISAVKQALVEDSPAADRSNTTIEQKERRAGVRTEESVTLVFDRNKSVLYRLYNRARRKNPGLKGKIILELTIAPSGKVTSISVVSSELEDETLESSIVKRIRQFDFGAQKVEEVKVTYPIVFLPS